MVKVMSIVPVFACLFVCITVNSCSRNPTPQEKIAQYSQSIGKHPADPWLYRKRGLIYLHLDMCDSALRDFDKAISLGDESVETYQSRGLIYYNTTKVKLALKDFDKAISLGDKSVETYRIRGNLLMDVGRYDLGMEDFTKAIGFSNGSPFLLRTLLGSRGLAYQALHKYNLAIRDFLEAAKADSQVHNYSSVAYASAGDCFIITGQNDSAIWAYKKQLEQTRPASTWKGYYAVSNHDRAKLAELLWLAGKHRLALSYLDSAIKGDSEDAECYYYHGVVNYKLGRDGAAIMDLKKVLAISRKFGGGWWYYPEYRLSAVYAKKGRTKEALKYLRIAVKRGFYFFDLVDENKDFARLRNTEGYRKLVGGVHAEIDSTMDKLKLMLNGNLTNCIGSNKDAIVNARFMSIVFQRDKVDEYRRLTQIIWDETFLPDSSILASHE